MQDFVHQQYGLIQSCDSYQLNDHLMTDEDNGWWRISVGTKMVRSWGLIRSRGLSSGWRSIGITADWHLSACSCMSHHLNDQFNLHHLQLDISGYTPQHLLYVVFSSSVLGSFFLTSSCRSHSNWSKNCTASPIPGADAFAKRRRCSTKAYSQSSLLYLSCRWRALSMSSIWIAFCGA